MTAQTDIKIITQKSGPRKSPVRSKVAANGTLDSNRESNVRACLSLARTASGDGVEILKCLCDSESSVIVHAQVAYASAELFAGMSGRCAVEEHVVTILNSCVVTAAGLS